MKKILSFCLIISLVLICVFSDISALAGSMNNFKNVNKYSESTYSDISSGEWYALYVQKCYELGLMQGVGNGVFDHNGNITIAQAITMASRVHKIYNENNAEFSGSGAPWYLPMVEYAINNKIISENDFASYDAYATRAQMAYIFSNSLPKSEFFKVNNLNTIPDVKSTDKYFNNILLLYVAGIVNGSDAQHNFYPDDFIKRREAAAIICRVAISSERIVIEDEEPQPPEIPDDYEEIPFDPEVDYEEPEVYDDLENVLFEDAKTTSDAGKLLVSEAGFVFYKIHNKGGYDSVQFKTKDVFDSVDMSKVRMGYTKVNWVSEKVSFIGFDVALTGNYTKKDVVDGPGQYSITDEDGLTIFEVGFTDSDSQKIRSVENFYSLSKSMVNFFVFSMDDGFYTGCKKSSYIIDFISNEVEVLNNELYYYSTGLVKGHKRNHINTTGEDMTIKKALPGEKIYIWNDCETITICDNDKGKNSRTVDITQDLLKNGIDSSKI